VACCIHRHSDKKIAEVPEERAVLLDIEQYAASGRFFTPKGAYIMSDWKETAEDKETQPPSDAKAQLSETGKQSIRGSLSTEAQGRIIDIGHLPVDKRPQAVADFRTSKEGKQAGDLYGGVMRDGKGVYFDDPDGHKHEIPYEEKKDEN
jgi:hypothetical protein